MEDKDIIRNITRWADGIVARVYSHETLATFVKEGTIPVINALSDKTVFYGRKIVRSKGVIHKDKRQSELTGSFKVKVIQTKIGTFFNYGDVQVEGHDKWIKKVDKDKKQEIIKKEKEYIKYYPMIKDIEAYGNLVNVRKTSRFKGFIYY